MKAVLSTLSDVTWYGVVSVAKFLLVGVVAFCFAVFCGLIIAVHFAPIVMFVDHDWHWSILLLYIPIIGAWRYITECGR